LSSRAASRIFRRLWFCLATLVFNVAPLLVGTKPLLTPIAVAILVLPMMAINALLERIVFTGAERLEIRSRRSERTRVA